MRSNLIRVEDLKSAIRACDGINSLAYLPNEATAVPVDGGWVMTCGPYVLRSARLRKPRVFKTVDALLRVAKDCGIEEVQVSLDLKAEVTS